MAKFGLLMALLLSFGFAKGQSPSISILQKSLNKMQALKSISYREKFISVNPLSKGDSTFGKSQTALVFDANGFITTMAERTDLNNGQVKYLNMYKADTLFTLDQTDSVYSVERQTKREEVACDIMEVKNLMSEAIKAPDKVFQKKDTIFNNALCYSFFFKIYDKVENAHHNYTYKYVLIDKETMMPVYTRENGEGVMEKGGYVIGQVRVFNEKYFKITHINQAISNKLFSFNRAAFSLKNGKMLADGSIAPAIDIKDLDNRALPSSRFKNKLMLVVFGATDCAANPLANPMLNRFGQRYASKDLAIVNVFTNEGSDKVKKYVAANKLAFPAYLGSKKLKRDFKTIATPNFYLIGTDGRVVKGFDGFSSELEPELTILIDRELNSGK